MADNSEDDAPFLDDMPLPAAPTRGVVDSVNYFIRENRVHVAVYSIGILAAFLYSGFLLGQLVDSQNHPIWVADIEVAQTAVYPEIEVCPFSSSTGASLDVLGCVATGYSSDCNYTGFRDPDTHGQCYRFKEGTGPSKKQQKLTVTLQLGLESLMGTIVCFRPPGNYSQVCSEFDAGKSNAAYLSPTKSVPLSGEISQGYSIATQTVSLYVYQPETFVQIDFYWETMTTRVQREIVTYTWLAFLGQCAGIISLIVEICPTAVKFILKRFPNLE